MVLPEELQTGFEAELCQFEEEQKMTYLSPFERHAMERGMQQGMRQKAQQNIIDALGIRFGELPQGLINQIQEVKEEESLGTLFHKAITAQSLSEFEGSLPSPVQQ